MNSKNSETSDPHRLLLKVTDKTNLKGSDIAFTIHGKNMKKSYKNNKFKISASRWNEEFQLPYGSCFLSVIHDYFKYILKKHGEKTDNPAIRIYVNKIEIRIPFKVKTGYYLELLTPETMRLYGNIKNKITKDENGGNFANLEITEVVLIHYNIVNNDYQQGSRVLHTFLSNKSFGHLLHILPQNFIF